MYVTKRLQDKEHSLFQVRVVCFLLCTLITATKIQLCPENFSEDNKYSSAPNKNTPQAQLCLQKMCLPRLSS